MDPEYNEQVQAVFRYLVNFEIGKFRVEQAQSHLTVVDFKEHCSHKVRPAPSLEGITIHYGVHTIEDSLELLLDRQKTSSRVFKVVERARKDHEFLGHILVLFIRSTVQVEFSEDGKSFAYTCLKATGNSSTGSSDKAGESCTTAPVNTSPLVYISILSSLGETRLLFPYVVSPTRGVVLYGIDLPEDPIMQTVEQHIDRTKSDLVKSLWPGEKAGRVLVPLMASQN